MNRYLVNILGIGPWLITRIIMLLVLFKYDLINKLPLAHEDLMIYMYYARLILEGYFPYSDFAPVYPPLSLVIFLLPKFITNTEHGYKLVFFLFMMLCELCCILLAIAIKRSVGGKRLDASSLIIFVLGYCVLFSSLGHIGYIRFDLVVSLVILISIYAMVRDRYILGWLFLAVGIGIKGYPAVIAPVFFIYALSRTRTTIAIKQGAIGLISGSALVWIPFVLRNAKGVLDVFTTHTSRGIEIGSSYATVLMVARWFGHSISTRHATDSIEIVSSYADALSKFSIIMIFIAMIAVWAAAGIAFIRRDPRLTLDSQFLIQYSALAILAFMLTFKILSPQFLIWFLVFVPLLRIDHIIPRVLLWMLAMAAGALTQVLVFKFFILVELNSVLIAVQVLRNTLLISLFVLMLQNEIRCKVRYVVGTSNLSCYSHNSYSLLSFTDNR